MSSSRKKKSEAEVAREVTGIQSIWREEEQHSEQVKQGLSAPGLSARGPVRSAPVCSAPVPSGPGWPWGSPEAHGA